MLKLRATALAAALIGIAAVPAAAADLPELPVYKSAPSPTWSWTGIYAGLNAGYGFGRASAFGLSENLDGFVGGGQVGANWQTGPLVLGIEADFQGTTQNRSTSFTVLGIGVTEKDSVPWFGTVRGRVGVAFDQLMLYGTGGWGYSSFKMEGTALGLTVSSSTNKGGVVYGGGAEWMFAPHWSAKAEFIRFDSGNTNVTLFGLTFPAKLTDNVARVGINYHF